MSGGQAKFQLRIARSGESSVYHNSSNGTVPLCHCVPLAFAATSAVAITNIAVDAIADIADDAIAITAEVTVAVNVDAGTVVAAVTAAIIAVNVANGVVDAVY